MAFSPLAGTNTVAASNRSDLTCFALCPLSPSNCLTISKIFKSLASSHNKVGQFSLVFCQKLRGELQVSFVGESKDSVWFLKIATRNRSLLASPYRAGMT